MIALARETRALADRYEELRHLATRARPGMYVPAHEAVTIAGTPITLGEAGPRGRQLLFFLTTTCPHCRASLSAWKTLAAEAHALGDVTVVGVALDSAHLVGPYARKHELSFPLVVLDDRRVAALYRVTRVPLTMVVDGTGRVRFARIGELTDQAAIDSVRAALTAPLAGDRETGPATCRSPPEPRRLRGDARLRPCPLASLLHARARRRLRGDVRA